MTDFCVIEPVSLTAEQKAQWITALRSGEYRQARGVLCHTAASDDSKSYCCLGVLQQLLGSKACPRFRPGSEYIDERVLNLGVQEVLSGMNDGRNDEHRYFTFEQIAEWIEKTL